jgi:hypothetical protein
MHNQSFCDKGKGLIKRDRSTDESEFRNLVINSGGEEMDKFVIKKHGNLNQEKAQPVSFYNQFSNQPTQRIFRSLSYHQL